MEGFPTVKKKKKKITFLDIVLLLKGRQFSSLSRRGKGISENAPVCYESNIRSDELFLSGLTSSSILFSPPKVILLE